MSKYNSFKQIDETEIKRFVSEYDVIDGNNFLKTILKSAFPYGYEVGPIVRTARGLN